jgi:hypothetical protein
LAATGWRLLRQHTYSHSEWQHAVQVRYPSRPSHSARPDPVLLPFMPHNPGIELSMRLHRPACHPRSGHMGSEAQCRGACADTERCRYAVRGWEHAPGWCVLLARCELPLDASPTGCGSSGANGVASWELHRQEPGAARTKKARKKKRKQRKKKTTTSM